MLGEDSFKRYLGNSLLVGVVSTVITLVLGCMAAYGLARFRFPGRKIMALGSLIAIPPLIFTFIAARQIITGLTAGAVKG